MGSYKSNLSERTQSSLTVYEKRKLRKYMKENNLTESAAVRMAVRYLLGMKPLKQ